MTRLNNINLINGSSPLKRVTIINRQGNNFNILNAQRVDNTIEITGTFTCGADDYTRLNQIVEDNKSDRMVLILPGGKVISRTFPIPPIDESMLSEALFLQAEAELPVSIGVHRRVAAIMPWTSDTKNGTGGKLAVAIGWPGTVLDDAENPEAVNLRYASQSACLLEFMALAGGNNLVGFVDRLNKTAELVMDQSGHTVFRGARINNGANLPDIINNMVMETAYTAELQNEELLADWKSLVKSTCSNTDSDSFLIITEEMLDHCHKQIKGTSRDSKWWSEYGLMVGAAIGLFGSRHTLYNFENRAPADTADIFTRTLDWLGQGNRAVAVCLITILLILTLPLGGAYARYEILKWKSKGIENIKGNFTGVDEEVQLYTLLKKERWPISKLLADICGSSHYHIQLEQLNIQIATSRITINGFSPDRLRSSEFNKNLIDTNMFDGLTSTYAEIPQADGLSYKFDITLDVKDPFLQVKSEYDYIDKPIWSLVWKEPADIRPENGYITTRPHIIDSSDIALAGGNPERGNSDISSSTNNNQRSNNTQTRTSSGSGSNQSNSRGVFDSASSAKEPAVLTEALIKVMDQNTTISEMNIRSTIKYRTRSYTPDVIARVNEEWIMLNNHLKELKKREGGN